MFYLAHERGKKMQVSANVVIGIAQIILILCRFFLILGFQSVVFLTMASIEVWLSLCAH